MAAFFRVWRFTRTVELLDPSVPPYLAGSARLLVARVLSGSKDSALRASSHYLPEGIALSHFRSTPGTVFAFFISIALW